MATEILMPALSAGMEEATIARWVKQTGDAVAIGDVIAEVETDKATLEMEAEAAGTIGRLLVADGGVAKVGAPIALLLAEGESAAAAPVAAPAVPTPVAVAAAVPLAAPVPVAMPAVSGGRAFVSPLARRLAVSYGVPLMGLSGSGPRGRIVRLDIERARAAAANRPEIAPVAVAVAPEAAVAVAAPAAAPAPKPMPWQAVTAHPNTGMRRTIARRLVDAKQTIPHFYLSREIELDAVLALRAQLNGRKGADYRLSVNDFIVKACGLALRRVPEANAMWTDDAILRFDTVDISVAVAIDGGLITPVVKNADAKGLATISAEVKDLAARARDGKLRPEDYQGGGFSVSNLGMYGVSQFAAIINPPQSCILAVGAAEERPVVRAGVVEVHTLMTVTLSVDHRSVDGAVGARVLAEIRSLLEDPLQLML